MGPAVAALTEAVTVWRNRAGWCGCKGLGEARDKGLAK